MPYYVYITTNKPRGVLYIGVTNDIARRTYEHQTSLIKGFTKKYNLKKLVYVESYDQVDEAIKREKQLKIGTERGKSIRLNLLIQSG